MAAIFVEPIFYAENYVVCGSQGVKSFFGSDILIYLEKRKGCSYEKSPEKSDRRIIKRDIGSP